MWIFQARILDGLPFSSTGDLPNPGVEPDSPALQSHLTLCNPMDCSPPGFSARGAYPGKNPGVGCHALLQGNRLNPGIEPQSPALQVDSLPAELPGKPKNTGVSSRSLLQGIFPTQELNPCLPDCRQTL